MSCSRFDGLFKDTTCFSAEMSSLGKGSFKICEMGVMSSLREAAVVSEDLQLFADNY